MDSVEGRLLDTVIREPADAHAREVYADWLEQHGWETRATFLRLDAIDSTPPEELARAAAATPIDAVFRAAVTRTKVARCVSFAFECTKRWSDLRRTDDDFLRHCDHCNKPVAFVATVQEALDRGATNQCIAIDPAVARGEVVCAYDRGKATYHNPMRMGVVAYPTVRRIVLANPPPPPPPPKPGVMTRIRGWFTK